MPAGHPIILLKCNKFNIACEQALCLGKKNSLGKKIARKGKGKFLARLKACSQANSMRPLYPSNHPFGYPVVFARRGIHWPPSKARVISCANWSWSTEVLLLRFCRAKFDRAFYPSQLVGNFKLLPSVVPGSRQASRVSSHTIRAFRL